MSERLTRQTNEKHPAFRHSVSDLRECLIETEREAVQMQEAIMFYFDEKFRTDATFTFSSMTEAEARLWRAAELTVRQFGNNE